MNNKLTAKTFHRFALVCGVWGLLLASNTFAALLYDTETLLPDPPPGLDFDQFGHSVDISGSNIIAGAPNLVDRGGQVFIESLTGPGTNVVTKRIFSEGTGGGWSVAIDGDRAVAGVPFPGGHFDFEGDAAFFQHIGSNWVLQTVESENGFPRDSSRYQRHDWGSSERLQQFQGLHASR